jgi:hypothetical protein
MAKIIAFTRWELMRAAFTLAEVEVVVAQVLEVSSTIVTCRPIIAPISARSLIIR